MCRTLAGRGSFPSVQKAQTGYTSGSWNLPNGPTQAGAVVGTWTAQTLTGDGSFKGSVVVQPPPGSLAPILLLGKFQGVFEDGWGIDAIGSHAGRWQLGF